MNYLRTTLTSFLLASTLGLTLLPATVLAQAPTKGPLERGCFAQAKPDAIVRLPNFGRPDCQQFDVIVFMLADIVNVLIQFVLAIGLIFLVITGYQFTASMGNKQGMEEAKRSLLYIVIGLSVVLSAFMVVQFLAKRYLTGS